MRHCTVVFVDEGSIRDTLLVDSFKIGDEVEYQGAREVDSLVVRVVLWCKLVICWDLHLACRFNLVLVIWYAYALIKEQSFFIWR